MGNSGKDYQDGQKALFPYYFIKIFELEKKDSISEMEPEIFYYFL